MARQSRGRMARQGHITIKVAYEGYAAALGRLVALLGPEDKRRAIINAFMGGTMGDDWDATADPNNILLDEAADQVEGFKQDIADAADAMEAGAEEVQEAFDEVYGEETSS